MKTKPKNRWQVLVDHPSWKSPMLVSRRSSRELAEAEARKLNQPYSPGRPLYFVELWESSNVLDTENSKEIDVAAELGDVSEPVAEVA